jgi:hypothetical protein
VVNEVYRVIVERPGHLDQFPFIECWQDAVLSWPTWLRPCLEEACRIIVARVPATSKFREKTKELDEEPEEISPPYVPLYPPLPPAPSSTLLPPTLDREAQGTVTPVKSGLEASGALTPLTSLSPMDPIPTLSPPVLTPLCGVFSVRIPPLLRLLLPCTCLREAQSPCIMTRKAKYKEEDEYLSISPLTP